MRIIIALALMATTTDALVGLGVDLGTSGVRVCVVERGARGVSILSEGATRWTDDEGREPAVWLRALRETIAKCDDAAVASGASPSPARQRRLLVGGATGAVRRPPMMYSDAVGGDAGAAALGAIDAHAPPGHTCRGAASALAKLLAWAAGAAGGTGRLDDAWLVGGASNAGCKVLRDFAFGDDELAALSLTLDAARTNDAGIYPLSKTGERFPFNDAAKEPKLPGGDDREAVLHDLLVGIADVERLGYAALADRGATPLRSVQTAGGGAKNPQWRALREAMLGVPVVGAENTDAAFGAALLALREA
ncbi:carbohydrate kinase [Aureococcus anophagefferens]|nr:carbohydrate kinase [Aureococcus anophagefferens]